MSSYISPAKVNLLFRVLDKRPDNYHEIASLYAAVGIYDRIEIVESETDHFWCSDSSVPTDSSNRIIKALHLFRAKSEIYKPVHIELTKAIPMQAGLGGGSSNASTALYAFNKLFDNPLTDRELQELGSRIGSDEAFFFSSGLAYGRGRGELLEDVEVELPKSITIAMPDNLFLGTRSVYDECYPNEACDVDPALLVKQYSSDYKVAANDLEPAAFRVLPSLHELKCDLEALGFDHVVMTGSGSAFVCYGDVKAPKIEGVTFYQVPFLKRIKECWYELPSLAASSR